MFIYLLCKLKQYFLTIKFSLEEHFPYEPLGQDVPGGRPHSEVLPALRAPLQGAQPVQALRAQAVAVGAGEDHARGKEGLQADGAARVLVVVVPLAADAADDGA